MTDKLRWLYCSACGAPEKGSSDCNCQYFVISREEFLGYTKALASSSVPDRQWQPMSSAPKNGTRVLLWQATGYVAAGSFKTYGFNAAAWRGDSGNLLKPTHWMPLPPPPEAPQEEGR